MSPILGNSMVQDLTDVSRFLHKHEIFVLQIRNNSATKKNIKSFFVRRSNISNKFGNS
jgi:hypothetical protein